jgi:deoxyribodipyrimidine photo-lyase
MAFMKDILELPLHLKDDPRVTVRRGGPPCRNSRCVVYWMQRAQRAIDNPALDLAIAIGNELRLPVVVFFSVIPNYPHANLRHYAFLNQGLRDIEEDLAQRHVAFIVRRPPENQLEKLMHEAGAAALIGDENHCREPERWRQVLARRLSMPFLTVDADVVVPTKLFADHFYALHIMRPLILGELPQYLTPSGNEKAAYAWKPRSAFATFDVRKDITQGWKHLDRSVTPVDTFTGGTHAALRRLREFASNALRDYPAQRNHPELDGTSRLSPYLHFGHIGPVTIALEAQRAVKEGKATQAAYDAFINQLIGWRELAVNFVKYVPQYDSFACAPAWAEKTLREHALDKRPYLYSLEHLEQANTHDELWNAAQKQMVRYGWMHNYLRMYWAKKILEWTPTPELAYQYAVLLNDRYELDGRDPNGYAGIAWSIAAVHDRPWFERPVFGTIRYMSRESSGRKFNSRRFIKNVEDGRWCGK